MRKIVKRIEALFLFLGISAQAQWVVQGVDLQTGWNVVCLKVNVTDAMCATVSAGQPVEVVSWWFREGNSVGGFTQSPDDPLPPTPEMRSLVELNSRHASFTNNARKGWDL